MAEVKSIENDDTVVKYSACPWQTLVEVIQEAISISYNGLALFFHIATMTKRRQRQWAITWIN